MKRLGRVPPPPVWGVHLDALGQWRGQLPSYVHRAVKEGQSGGSVDTADQRKGRVGHDRPDGESKGTMW